MYHVILFRCTNPSKTEFNDTMKSFVKFLTKELYQHATYDVLPDFQSHLSDLQRVHNTSLLGLTSALVLLGKFSIGAAREEQFHDVVEKLPLGQQNFVFGSALYADYLKRLAP